MTPCFLEATTPKHHPLRPRFGRFDAIAVVALHVAARFLGSQMELGGASLDETDLLRAGGRWLVYMGKVGVEVRTFFSIHSLEAVWKCLEHQDGAVGWIFWVADMYRDPAMEVGLEMWVFWVVCEWEYRSWDEFFGLPKGWMMFWCFLQLLWFAGCKEYVSIKHIQEPYEICLTWFKKNLPLGDFLSSPWWFTFNLRCQFFLEKPSPVEVGAAGSQGSSLSWCRDSSMNTCTWVKNSREFCWGRKWGGGVREGEEMVERSLCGW